MNTLRRCRGSMGEHDSSVGSKRRRDAARMIATPTSRTPTAAARVIAIGSEDSVAAATTQTTANPVSTMTPRWELSTNERD